MTAPRTRRIAAAFDAAEAYDAHAVAQRHAAGLLAARLDALDLPDGARVLEIGCGTGLLGSLARPLLHRSDWLMTDLAPAMLARCRARFADEPHARHALLDGERPAFAEREAPFDLVCGNLVVQWFDALAPALARLLALLEPGGHLVVTTLAADSFAEWRDAHRAAGVEPGTPRFPGLAELQALRIGGVLGTVERALFVERHGSTREFVRALKAIGAGTPAPGHRPLGPAAFARVSRAFEAMGAPARYEIALCRFVRPGGAA